MKSSTEPRLMEDLEREEELPILETLDKTTDKTSEKRTTGERFREAWPSIYARRGLLWLSVAVFFQAAQVITVTDLAKKFGATQALFFRSSFLLLTVLGLSWSESESYNLSDMLIFILSSFFDTIFIYGTILASKFIWVGDVTSISLNQQVPSAILAAIFLGEALDILDGLFIALNATGVVLVSQPSFLFSYSERMDGGSESLLPGFLLAFLSLAGSVLNVLLYRTLVHRKTEDSFLLATLTGMTGLFVSSCEASIKLSWDFPESSEEWLTTIVSGVFTLLAFISFLQSLNTESVKTATVMLTIAIPITTLYDFIILGRHTDLAKIGGVLLILGTSFAMHLKTILRSREL